MSSTFYHYLEERWNERRLLNCLTRHLNPKVHRSLGVYVIVRLVYFPIPTPRFHPLESRCRFTRQSRQSRVSDVPRLLSFAPRHLIFSVGPTSTVDLIRKEISLLSYLRQGRSSLPLQSGPLRQLT